MNRAERVLQYIQEFGSISPLEAFRDLGYTRLSAAIFELKRNGYRIKTEVECGVNRYGHPVHYARYSLHKAKNHAV